MEPELIDVDHVLKKEVFQSESGERFIITTGDTTKHGRASLDQMLASHVEADAYIGVSNTNARSRVGCIVWAPPARACKHRSVISLSDIYAFLKLTCYKKTPSKWIFMSTRAWETAVARFGLSGNHFWKSSHGGSSSGTTKGNLPFYLRCLPFQWCQLVRVGGATAKVGIRKAWCWRPQERQRCSGEFAQRHLQGHRLL